MNSAFSDSEMASFEDLFYKSLNKALISSKHAFSNNEWMTLKDSAKYAGVSYNTFMKFRELGLKICEIDGVKRVSRRK